MLKVMDFHFFSDVYACLKERQEQGMGATGEVHHTVLLLLWVTVRVRVTGRVRLG